MIRVNSIILGSKQHYHLLEDSQSWQHIQDVHIQNVQVHVWSSIRFSGVCKVHLIILWSLGWSYQIWLGKPYISDSRSRYYKVISNKSKILSRIKILFRLFWSGISYPASTVNSLQNPIHSNWLGYLIHSQVKVICKHSTRSRRVLYCGILSMFYFWCPSSGFIYFSFTISMLQTPPSSSARLCEKALEFSLLVLSLLPSVSLSRLLSCDNILLSHNF